MIFWFASISKKFLNSSSEITLMSGWNQLLHLWTLRAPISVRRVSPLLTRPGISGRTGNVILSKMTRLYATQAFLKPQTPHRRQRLMKHCSRHSIHLNLPNAIAVKRSHRRSPWRQSPSDPGDPPLSGTVQLTPGIADCFPKGPLLGSSWPVAFHEPWWVWWASLWHI